jgi:hypothetical protein
VDIGPGGGQGEGGCSACMGTSVCVSVLQMLEGGVTCLWLSSRSFHQDPHVVVMVAADLSLNNPLLMLLLLLLLSLPSAAADPSYPSTLLLSADVCWCPSCPPSPAPGHLWSARGAGPVRLHLHLWPPHLLTSLSALVRKGARQHTPPGHRHVLMHVEKLHRGPHIC